MSPSDKEAILEYAGLFQHKSFHRPILRTRNGRTQLTCKLIGVPRTQFRQVRAPYTRQFLKHMPREEPQVLEAREHDHKQIPENRESRKKAIRPTTGGSKG